jgi:hypothetical protein
LTAERAVSAVGFKRGNEGFKNAERTRSLIKKMTAFQRAEALAGHRYDRDKLLAMVAISMLIRDPYLGLAQPNFLSGDLMVRRVIVVFGTVMWLTLFATVVFLSMS